MSGAGAGVGRGEERGRCSVFDCARPAVVTYRAGAMFDDRCAVHASFPSARACLLAGLAVRNGQKRGWAIYPTGSAYDLYPGDEGPQRELTLDEALDAIGGDQQCVLAPAGVIQWPTLTEGAHQLLLAGISPNGSAEEEGTGLIHKVHVLWDAWVSAHNVAHRAFMNLYADAQGYRADLRRVSAYRQATEAEQHARREYVEAASELDRLESR